MSASKVVLVLGAGGNVGGSTATLFAAHGYKVALAARRLQDAVQEDGHLHIKTDLTDPASVTAAFDKTIAQFGIPSVVIYNAAAFHGASPDDPLSLSYDVFKDDFMINTHSVFVAAQRAVQAFRELPASSTKTFLYTGNILNVIVAPTLLTLGVGKAASAHIVEIAAKAYADKGFRFHYVDERAADGKPVYNAIDGGAHAKRFLELAETQTRESWWQTFVAGHGYKDFSKTEPAL